jgi:imidazolonepropionase-like amidohydrolase
VNAARRAARKRRRHARDQGTVEAGTLADRLIVNGAPRADVTRLRRRESLALVMQDGLADPGSLQPARWDRA